MRSAPPTMIGLSLPDVDVWSDRVTVALGQNPGIFTGPGTNTYVLESRGRALVIDPGPIVDGHLDAVEATLGGLDPVAVAVTHTHPDHAPAANPLALRIGVPAYGFAPGPDFEPSRVLADGDTITFGDAEAVALHTPGHTSDHLCFLVGDLLFTGDHLMGGSTVIIEDLNAYLASLRRLLDVELARLWPGHGPHVDDPHALIREYIAHRLEREEQVVAALAGGAGTLGEVVLTVYADIDPALHRAAAWSVAAHLRKLADGGRVEFAGAAEWGASVRFPEEVT